MLRRRIGGLAVVFLIASLWFPGCGGPRTSRVPLRFDRAVAPTQVRVERRSPEGAGVPLAQMSGEFLVESVASIVDLAYEIAVDLLASSGERVRVLVDGPRDQKLLPNEGEIVTVAYAHRGSPGRREWFLEMREPAGRLLFLVVQRSPQSAPFPVEERLSPPLRVRPTRARLYAESVRRPNFCTSRLLHRPARLGSADEPLLRPGERRTVALPDGSFVVHLSDLFDVGEEGCAPVEAGLLAYEIMKAAP